MPTSPHIPRRGITSRKDYLLVIYRHPAIVRVIEQIFEEEAIGVQTMFYVKPPLTPGHAWHQDQLYLAGDPKPVVAAWCALDDIDEENGALTVYPGSHKLGMLEMKPNTNPDFEYFPRLRHSRGWPSPWANSPANR